MTIIKEGPNHLIKGDGAVNLSFPLNDYGNPSIITTTVDICFGCKNQLDGFMTYLTDNEYEFNFATDYDKPIKSYVVTIESIKSAKKTVELFTELVKYDYKEKLID